MTAPAIQSTLHRAPAAHEVQHEQDDRDEQDHVDSGCCHVESKEAKKPDHNKHGSYDREHFYTCSGGRGRRISRD